jgi:hypothetical protein
VPERREKGGREEEIKAGDEETNVGEERKETIEIRDGLTALELETPAHQSIPKRDRKQRWSPNADTSPEGHQRSKDPSRIRISHYSKEEWSCAGYSSENIVICDMYRCDWGDGDRG